MTGCFNTVEAEIKPMEPDTGNAGVGRIKFHLFYISITPAHGQSGQTNSVLVLRNVCNHEEGYTYNIMYRQK